MRNIKSSGLCNKHDWFEAGNPLEQKCGTISTVAILFVLILGTTRYVISTIASAVCFYWWKILKFKIFEVMPRSL